VGITILWCAYKYGGRDALAVLCSFAAVAFATEFSNLLPGGKLIQWVFIVLSIALIYIGIFAEHLFLIELGLSFVLITLIVLSRVGKKFNIEEGFSQLSFFGFGLLYCAVLPVFVFRILYVGEDPRWFLFYLCLVFVGDTGAYLAGATIGKTKLLEIVSPKKSVEGAIAGLSATIATAIVGLWFFSVPAYQIVICAVAVSCVAQMGDLVESLLKRAVHVKDSGRLMPGHGGMMDRLDGIYFAGPVFYWFLKLWTGS
jgi:phosphatidate cytidylyltransferase